MEEERDQSSIQEVIREKGSVLWHISGASMKPLICDETDIVVIRRIEGPIKPWDVVLFKNRGKLILHRVLENRGDHCVILGDNCVSREYIPRENIIGILGDVIRDGQPRDMNSLKHRAYMRFWVRPWRMRVVIIRVRSAVKRAWWNGVALLSPYTPEPIKRRIKALIIKGE